MSNRQERFPMVRALFIVALCGLLAGMPARAWAQEGEGHLPAAEEPFSDPGQQLLPPVGLDIPIVPGGTVPDAVGPLGNPPELIDINLPATPVKRSVLSTFLPAVAI